MEAQTYDDTEAQGVVGDGMPRRVMRLSRDARNARRRGAGVRALIVAAKGVTSLERRRVER